MYSLLAILLIVPLYFSHVFSPFGLIIGESSSFERQKVYMFLLLVISSYMEHIIRGKDILGTVKKYIQEPGIKTGVVSIILLPWCIHFINGSIMNPYWFIGSIEKIHGYLFFLGILGYIFSWSLIDKSMIQKILHGSMLSACIMSIIALYECQFGSPFFHQVGTISWEAGRVIGTLGNPNYLAGYILIHIPLLKNYPHSIKFPIAILFIAVIYFTGSYIALGLICIWILFSLLSLKIQYHQGFLLLGIISFCISISIPVIRIIEPEKLLSLMSRFVLMGDILTYMIQYPFIFLTGMGPDSIITHYHGIRSTLIESYFPSSLAIDSSHNFFLDILFQFGILPIIAGGTILFKYWKSLSSMSQTGILLGGSFLSLNVMIVSHLIILIPLFFLTRTSGIDKRTRSKSSLEPKKLNP